MKLAMFARVFLQMPPGEPIRTADVAALVGMKGDTVRDCLRILERYGAVVRSQCGTRHTRWTRHPDAPCPPDRRGTTHASRANLARGPVARKAQRQTQPMKPKTTPPAIAGLGDALLGWRTQ